MEREIQWEQLGERLATKGRPGQRLRGEAQAGLVRSGLPHTACPGGWSLSGLSVSLRFSPVSAGGCQ